MRYALVYGGLAGGIIIAVICLGIALDLPGHMTSPLFGYTVMLVALSLIFVAVKRYRDVEGGGVIRFGRAFMLGLGVALVASLIYIIGWEIYLAAAGADFIADMSAAMLRQMESSGASAADIARFRADMDWMAARYPDPLFRIPVTFAEIFPVGLVVALVSAAILRNPRVLPARTAAA